MRPTWKGQLSIGLLNVPVHIYAAVKEHDTRFNQLHDGCGERVRYQKVCPTHEVVLDAGQIVKGVQVARGEYVTLTDDELDQLPLPSIGAIHIEGFLPAAAIPALRKQKPTYLGPDRGGAKGYSLLYQVMAADGLAAVGKVAMRGNEQLVAIEPGEANALVCWYLYWTDEVASAGEVAVTTEALKPQEIALAKQMVAGFSLEAGLDSVTDGTEEALRQLIAAKTEGLQVERPAAVVTTNVADLMDTIRANMALAAQRKGAA